MKARGGKVQLSLQRETKFGETIRKPLKIRRSRQFLMYETIITAMRQASIPWGL
jgi:hypothetical protein